MPELGVARIQREAELREAITSMHEAVSMAGGFSWHQDALYVVETAALESIEEVS